jgi:hypothetical protein
MKRRYTQWWETIASISTKHTTELVSLTFHSDLRKLNTEPSIGASHQVSVHLKIDHFVPIHWQTWPPQAILVSDWSISKNLLP